MKRPLVVLSLFDGISCGQQALRRAGIHGYTYYSSEIDDVAISITQKRFPHTIQVGDICKLKGKEFKYADVDVILAGFPCQNTSRMGKTEGITTKDKVMITSLKQYLRLKKTPGVEFNSSALFWEFVRIYKKIQKYNPKVKFFVENVANKFWESVITDALNTAPKTINSSLLTAQNRERNYWTDIPCSEIHDLRIKIGDVIPGAVSGAGKRGRKYPGDKYYTPCLTVRKDKKSNCLVTTPYMTNQYVDKRGNYYVITPDQAEMLQSIEKGFTDIKGITTTARYRLIGNAWTVDVIVKFFENLKSLTNAYK